MPKVLDCVNIVYEFKLHLRYYIHIQANILGEGMNLLISKAIG